MTKEETWKKLLNLGVVKGIMPSGQWDLSKTHLFNADLSGADLSEVNFTDADLMGVNLSNADLSNATLVSAYIMKSNLSGIDLSTAELSHANLNRANLSGANLSGASLSSAKLWEADLSNADLSRADLIDAYLFDSNLNMANLRNADLSGADLNLANLSGADLSGADLTGTSLRNANLYETNLNMSELNGAILIKANLRKANLSGCRVYGISAWDLDIDENTKQIDLVITPHDEPIITVDNIEVAQFIYLLLNNEKIRDVINTITTKVVLILGRFTAERKPVLDAIREELRKHDYIPVLFDFDKPSSRDLTETVSTLAHMARFIIADITDPQSIPHELYSIVPHLSVPIKPILKLGADEYAMFKDLYKYDWVLDKFEYNDTDHVIKELPSKVIAPAEEKAKELIN